MKLRDLQGKGVYRIMVLVPFLRMGEMETGIFFHPSPYIKVAGKPMNSITPCKETVCHQYRNSRPDRFGGHQGLVLNK